MKKMVSVISLLFIVSNIFAQNTTVNYTSTDSLFANPERGFYKHTETHSANYTSLNANTLKGYRTNQNITLIMRVFYLEDFKTTPISNAYLNLIQQDLDAIRSAGLKCIMRFAYNDSQGATDASKNIIFQHLDQLKLIFKNNVDVIALVNAGFIGSWGEWYYTTQSEFGIPPAAPNYTNRAQVLAKIHAVLPKSRMVQLRTPLFKTSIFATTAPISSVQAHTGTNFARTGHHNDCFLASADDYGTYNNVTNDKNYLSKDCLYAPNGGETCNPSNYSDCANTLVDMSNLHYSYINMDYHPTVVTGWTTVGCIDEIKRKLGYRLKLIRGQFSNVVAPGGSFNINLKLFNSGWAAPYNPRGVEIIIRSVATPSQKFIVGLPDDPRFWLSGDSATINRSITIPANVPFGMYDVFLNLPDTISSLKNKPEYSIRLGNKAIWEATTGYNKLNFQLNVSNTTNIYSYNQNNSSISFSPNPSGHDLNISGTMLGSGRYNISVMDISGRLIMQEDIFVDYGLLNKKLNVSNLLQGIYFVNIKGAQENYTKKFVKE